jgi:cell division protein FtsQ
VNGGEPKRKAVRWALIMGGVLIAAASIALYTPWLSLFDLREIVVSGNQHVSAQEIGRASGFAQGENLLTAPVGRAVQRLNALPWVASASIHRILPHTLGITIKERTPVAVVKTSDKPPAYLLLASGGVIVQTASGPRSALPTLSGVTLSGQQPGARIVDPRVVETLAALASTQLDGKILQQIDFSDPADVTLHGEGDLVIQLGPLNGISGRIDDLGALLDTIDLAKYRSIDMRIGGEATLVPRKVVNR